MRNMKLESFNAGARWMEVHVILSIIQKITDYSSTYFIIVGDL